MLKQIRMETTRSETLVKGKTTSAKKIPYWLWIVIAKSLGIKLHPNDKPVLSAILHIATFGSATGLLQSLISMNSNIFASLHFSIVLHQCLVLPLCRDVQAYPK